MSMTSLEVFMKFVRCLDTTSDSTAAARLDVSGVVSRECFGTWLRTRRSSVKHPEQTFHRILLCHLRGSDTRKPFPPEVEKAIIALLNSEEACALWDRCFNGNLLKVGKNGFRGLGYNEKLEATKNVNRGESQVQYSSKKSNFEFDLDLQELRLPSKIDSNRCMVPRLNCGNQYQNDIYPNSKSRLTLFSNHNPKMKLWFEEFLANPFDASNNETSYNEWDNLNRYQNQLQIQSPLPPLQRALRSALLTPISDEPDWFTPELHKCQTPWERLCAAAERMNLSHESEQGVDPVVADFIKGQVAVKASPNWNELMWANNGDKARSRFGDVIANQFGTHMFPPAVAYMLRQNIPDEYDKRFDPSFIYPNPDQCSFSENKPVGWSLSDYSTGKILEVSDEAKLLLRGDYSGMYMYSPFASLFHFWYCCSLKLPRNNDWIRWQLLRRDGTRGLFLSKINIFPDHSRLVHFQDISDDHPDVLNKPFLI